MIALCEMRSESVVGLPRMAETMAPIGAGWSHDGVNHVFSLRAWSVIGFDRCHFRGCEVELEEQRLGLLGRQLRHRRHRGYRLYLLRPCSRLYARLAEHSGPGILGAGDDFLDNRSTGANQRRDTELCGRHYRT